MLKMKKDNCKKCKMKRNNSSRSCNSNSVNTAVTSLSSSKGDTRREKDDHQDQLEGLKFLAERDMHSLHRHIPALGRKDVQISAIRQHYYPEGGWGWVVVFCSLLAHCLTTGNLLAGGFVALQLKHTFKTGDMVGLWAPLLAWASSLCVAPFVTYLCREYSVRLVAVISGLVLNMAFLFASFGSQLHQVVLSYGILLGAASGGVRGCCSIMIGQYFKSRRLLVEVFVSAGSGLGIMVFSLLYRQSVSSLGWRLGLQSMQSVFIVAFFLGLFYRSASLYHPQRDAISHIKHQKEKVKSKSFNESIREQKKVQIIDFSILMERNVLLYLVSVCVSAGGIYTPFFLLPVHVAAEVDEANQPLLGVWLGLATMAGSIGGGVLLLHGSQSFFISKQLLLQAAIFSTGLSLFCLYMVSGFYGYILVSMLYGASLGVYLYVSKVFCYTLVSTKEFSRVWSMVEASQTIPTILGVSITGYINESYEKPGYWLSVAFVLIGGGILSLLPPLETGNLGQLPSQPDEEEVEELRCGDLADLDDFNNASMSCNSKVDKFFNQNNIKSSMKKSSNLRRLSILSYSDPEKLNTHKNSSIILERHNSLYLNSTEVFPDNQLRDVLIVDQITSTV